MYSVLNQPIKFSDGRIFKAGDKITFDDFCEELPESRKRERIIAQLIEGRRIISIPVETKNIINSTIKHRGRPVKNI